MVFLENFLRLTVTVRLQKMRTSKTWIFLSDSNEIGTHNHLVCSLTFNHLAKLAKWLNSQFG